MHGQFVWYDLMTSDVAGAQRFYPRLFGWKTQKFEQSDPANPYTMWTVGGEPIGGVAKLDANMAKAGVPPHWITSVHVNNVDQTAQQASSLGGNVVAPPFDIPGTGRYAIISDPTGATLAIFSSTGPTSTFDGTTQLGKPSWHELMTTDYKRAFEFYGKLFGWEKTSEMEMGPGATYFMFGMKGKPFGGMYNRPAEMGQTPPFWLPYVFVKDVTESANAAKAAGGKITQPPMDIPGGGSIAVLTDPQGAVFAVHAASGLAAPKASAKAKTGNAKTGNAKTGKAKAGKAKTAKKAAKKKAAPKRKAAPKKKGGSKKAKKSAKKKGRRR